MSPEKFFADLIPDMVNQWHHYFSILQPQPGDTILDVGCNNGDIDKGLLMAYPNVKKVVGVDSSVIHHDASIARWQSDGSPSKLEFVLADARDLPFPNAYFDRIFCADTLEWIKNPVPALQEMRRVLKPGGFLMLVHTDFDTQVFNTADKQLCRKVVLAFSDAGPDGQIGRELLGLCRRAGFKSVRPLVYILVNTEWKPDQYSFRTAHMMVDWLLDKSLVSRNELDGWIGDLEYQNKQGNYFYSVNRNICFCQS